MHCEPLEPDDPEVEVLELEEPVEPEPEPVEPEEPELDDEDESEEEEELHPPATIARIARAAHRLSQEEWSMRGAYQPLGSKHERLLACRSPHRRWAALGLALAACASGAAPSVDAGPPEIDAGPTCGCTAWSRPADAGVIDPQLPELSGLVASRSQPGVLYAHNDSGDAARFFALSTSGAVLQTFTLDGATARDWEDLALGPCPDGTCVYLGDVGDNDRVRADCAIYRVKEPPVTSGTASVAWERFPFTYPNGERHNAETIFMHPATGRLYLVTKEVAAPSEVYRFPLPFDAGKTAVLEHVAQLPVPTATDGQLTGGDVNVCGTAVLLRMYNRLVELRLPEGASDFEQIFSATPVQVPVAHEDQGEAVTYGPDGRAFFTAGEKLVSSQVLSRSACAE